MAAAVTRRAGCAALVLGLCAHAAIVFGQEVPPPAYQLAAQQAGVPSPVLYAVALQESGARLRGRLIPWPWTLNVAGRAERYATRAEACAGSRCRRGVASSDAAGSGRISPLPGLAGGVGVGAAPEVDGGRLRWNSESMANPGRRAGRESLLAFSGRAIPLGPIPLPLPQPFGLLEAFGYRATEASQPQPMRAWPKAD